MRRAFIINGFRIGLAVLLLGVWQTSADLWPILDFTVGSPKGILREFIALVSTGEFIIHFGITLIEAITGFLSGTSVGVVLGLVFWGSRMTHSVFKPYIAALGALPIIALGPMMIFWFGTGVTSKIVVGFISTVTVAMTQAHTGAGLADPELIRMVRAFGGSQRDVFWRIVVPSSGIWVLSGIRMSVSMALLGAFVAEFIASRAGLGYLIITAEGLYNVNQIWVGVVGILLIAAILHASVTPLARWARRLRTSNTI